jgi:hypothetical protein
MKKKINGIIVEYQKLGGLAFPWFCVCNFIIHICIKYDKEDKTRDKTEHNIHSYFVCLQKHNFCFVDSFVKPLHKTPFVSGKCAKYKLLYNTLLKYHCVQRNSANIFDSQKRKSPWIEIFDIPSPKSLLFHHFSESFAWDSNQKILK